ncbi:MAG: LysE family translocator [Anaerolineae bacterium]|nr:LysE family translocator [Anaerolineae bacterium]
MLAIILQGIGYGFTGAVQPGPFQTYLISQSIQRGWRKTLCAALAPLISDGPIIVLAILLLTRLPAGWERLLYMVGGVFVLTLAWGAFRSWRDFDLADPVVDGGLAGQGMLQAALMNVLSPGPYLFWGLVTGPILLSAWRESPLRAAGFLIGFYGTMVTSLAVVIVLFSTARRLGVRVARAMVGISAVTLTCFGVYQIWQGIG